MIQKIFFIILFIYTHFSFSQTINKSESTYLNSKELFYNTEYYNIEQYYFPLDFKQSKYKKLSFIDKRWSSENKEWHRYTYEEYYPLKKEQVIYDSKSRIISLSLLSSNFKTLYKYDKKNRITSKSSAVYDKITNVFSYKYPDKRTTVVNDSLLIKTYDESNRIIKSVKKQRKDLIVTYDFYYTKNNLPNMIKRTFKSLNNVDHSFSLKYLFAEHLNWDYTELYMHLTYKLNEYGDWTEIYITKSDSINSEKIPYRLIQRKFE
ncbi:hypothetical protein [Cellulophaga omnivescoria]|uniref:hypothetical protein n=1 Tax=Cellulophaga omnivescoria TaxID=1888890 RepID=UPI000987681E|nr:hypothetical protein [Cellulophaga omnivescoria]WBU88548.1 hypothetical protein PBN93_11765 [Cellulophaga omnivescoria]